MGLKGKQSQVDVPVALPLAGGLEWGEWPPGQLRGCLFCWGGGLGSDSSPGRTGQLSKVTQWVGVSEWRLLYQLWKYPLPSLPISPSSARLLLRSRAA